VGFHWLNGVLQAFGQLYFCDQLAQNSAIFLVVDPYERFIICEYVETLMAKLFS